MVFKTAQPSGKAEIDKRGTTILIKNAAIDLSILCLSYKQQLGKGSFETSRPCNIPAYQVYGKTIEKKLFASDKGPRYIHLYHSSDLEAHERGEVEKKINQLTTFLKSNINKFREFGPGMETYFELYYDENAKQKPKKGAKKRKKKKKGI